MVELAVIAHIRHNETDYDAELMRIGDRGMARQGVRGEVRRILDEWKGAAVEP